MKQAMALLLPITAHERGGYFFIYYFKTVLKISLSKTLTLFSNSSINTVK